MPEGKGKPPLGVVRGRVRQQTSLERALERTLLLAGKGLVAVIIGAATWSFLIFCYLFLAGGDLGGWRWADPRSSPIGPWLTVLVVWPALGVLGIFLQDVPSEVLAHLGKRARGVFARRGRVAS